MAGPDRLAIINSDGTFANPLVETHIQAVAQTAAELYGGGGGGAPLTSYLLQVVNLPDYPPSFPPDSHSHEMENISDSGSVGRAVLAATTTADARSAIGLDNVNNTTDADKPVSTATQNALNAKRDKTTPTTFPVHYISGAWQYTTLAAALAAGMNSTDTAIFFGNPGGTPPSWIRDTDFWTMGG